MSSIKGFIWRGALAGMLGGVLAAVFHWAVTEDQIRRALAIEAAGRAGGAHDEMFSRTTQVAGGMVAAVVYGVFLGVVFAIVLAKLAPGIPGRLWFNRSIRLAAAGFTAWVIVPGLKYPPNPPAVGDPDTIGQRTGAFAALLLVSLVLAYLAWELWRRLTADGASPARRFVIVTLAYVAAITAAYLLFPANTDEITVPATLVWHFRLDSFAGSALIWLTIGTAVGILADRGSGSRAAVDQRVSIPV